MFPDAEDLPAFLAEENSRVAVALDVASDFSVPVFFIRGGHAAMFGAAVPETAVDENGEALFWENEIGPAGEARVAAPAFKFSGAEERNEEELGGLVAAGMDCGHDSRAFGFREGVGHCPSMRATFCAGNSGGDLKISGHARFAASARY